MTRIANTRTRTYHSALRAEQAEETRGRILDAALRVMTTGLARLSVPAVAREAGVSVPTVYRHFGTKAELLAEMYPHVARRSGSTELAFPTSLDEVRDGVRAYASQLDALNDLERAAMASPAAAEVRQLSMAHRSASTRRLIESIAPNVPEANRERIARLVMVLLSSASLRMWRDHLGSSVEEVADDIVWVLRAVTAAATTVRSGG